MFKSYKHITPNMVEITDDNFKTTITMVPRFVGVWGPIMKEYERRNLDVGKNIAAAIAWYSYFGHAKQFDRIVSINGIVDYQNRTYSAYFENWKEIVKSRDHYLKLFMIWG